MLTRIVVVLFTLAVAFATLGADSQPKIKKVSVSQTSPSSGAEMFGAYCAVCHGKDAKGGGPAAAGLKTPPPDLTALAARSDGKYPELRVYDVIRGDVEVPAHGSKDMPVWGALFQSMGHDNGAQAQLRISNLVSYIKGLQSK